MSSNLAYNQENNNQNINQDDNNSNLGNFSLDDVFTGYNEEGDLTFFHTSNTKPQNNSNLSLVPNNQAQQSQQSNQFNVANTQEYQQLLSSHNELKSKYDQILGYLQGQQGQQQNNQPKIPLSQRLQEEDGESFLVNLVGLAVDNHMSKYMNQIQPQIQSITTQNQAQQQYNRLINAYPDLEDVIYSVNTDVAKGLLEKFGVEATYLMLKGSYANQQGANNRANQPLDNQQVTNFRQIASKQRVENGSQQMVRQMPAAPKTRKEAIMLAMNKHNWDI